MKTLLICTFIFAGFYSNAQVYTNKVVGKKNEAVIDSLKEADYPYVLPILGAKATKAGFHLPYSAGLGVQYVWQKSELVIENLMVGFNNGPMYDLDEVIRFDDAVSEVNAINVRQDIWLFPFLNVYGLLARANPSTAIDAGVYVPDENGSWSEVVSLQTTAEFEATSLGFGMTPTIGVGGGWMALDFNCTWTDIPELDKPAFAFIFGPRFGKSFQFKKPDSNLAVWVGGFRLKLSSETNGSIDLGALFNTEELQVNVDDGIQNVGDKQIAVDNWWSGLTPVEQKNPVNIAKYETANRALATAGEFLNSMDEALNDGQSASVQYSLDKRPKDMWNFVTGVQYQYSKHLVVRVEAGFLGSRNQVVTSLQYRFGL